MLLFRASRSRLAKSATCLIAAAMVCALSASAALASPTTHKKKALSLASVTVVAGTTPNVSPIWIAQAQGFFRAQGVTVTYLPAASSSVQTAVLIAGSAQFAIDSPSSDLAADAQGAPIRAVEMEEQDSDQELVLTQAAATQFNVPASGNSKAGAIKQMDALKGSHALVAVSNLTSNSYVDLGAVAHALGLTFGLGCTTCDINISSVGTPAAEATAIESGKVQGMINSPPTTVIPSPPATVTIQAWRIPPLTAGAANYLSTTVSMIQQHPDTVQAVVTGVTQASLWLKGHAKQALKDAGRQLAINGITSPEEQDYLFAGIENFIVFPYPTKAAYKDSLAEYNVSQATPLTVPYSGYVIPKFVIEAGKILHVKVN